MGVIVKYTCKHCDFVADEVFVGPGMVSYIEPVLCQDCGSVSSCAIDEQTRKLVEKYAHCKNCDSSNLIVWNRKCPKCGLFGVDEECVGMWD